ncbi:UDP-N-acetylmuramoyl-L-alanyl-D-glutamate--2,6-diaminopimelate ligase [Paenibacillus turpanensis]|uniref:UDP-N-acetylmuramoyl-L-alanyl-D-glutamate--2, 6-diaminopimelate ligase n=1 Tax=Paenibacillus turpanensis TaxID=2689078 RepID=UPI00140B2DD2|nr:UDP-N-acetylmuramoyl-L-alanyl-D-glutamate--2,6-diaminopimelate ligase [Paenibacillus turpanensis]
MQLQELGDLLYVSRITGDSTVSFNGIATDSRKVAAGQLFICLPGHTVDGHQYAPDAVAQGAAALVVERELELDVPQLIVPDARYAMAVIANHYYQYPSRSVNVIGVTGTNGKTTTTYLIEKILEDHGARVGLMGTIRVKIGDVSYEAERTTLDAADLQHNLRKMADAGCTYCVMEVSSHALEQGRVKGVRFRTAVFTNLTQDHLDYHQTMENYREAKGLLFSRLGNSDAADPADRRCAVLNADDPASAYFAGLTSAQLITYGVDRTADVRALDVKLSAQGVEFIMSTFAGEVPMRLNMLGKFNVYNALAAAAAALAEGVPLEHIKASLESIPGVEGRVEAVNEGQSFAVLVDYAHSPDGLQNVLSTVKEFAEKRIITVFGCGGDRDRTKRPIMGRIAAEYSDYVIVTSDNPRSEEPNAILKDIEQGIAEYGYPKQRYELIEDRRQAIEKAIEMAGPEDVVLIAGKGHETYQIIQGVTHDFDDRVVAANAIRRITNR